MPTGTIDVHPERHHDHHLERGNPKGSLVHHDHHIQGGENDEQLLAALGYKQELRREFGWILNFGTAFSIISIVTGITTLFEYGLTTGGPAVMSSGWIIVCLLTFPVALSMAEIVSSVPTSGGPYHWAAILARDDQSAFWAWVVGYFNLLGQVAVTTGISYGNAQLIGTLASVYGFAPTPGKTIGIFAGLIVSHGAINTLGIRTMKYFNYTSIAIQSIGVASLAIATLAMAPTRQSGSFVFGTFVDLTGGWSEVASPAYVAVIGILMSQYTITGYDASAHLSEETRDAARSAPIGVITAVGVSAIFGWFYILALLFSIQDLDNVTNSASGQPVLQIFTDAFGQTGATVAMVFVIICIYHCGLFSITANSRMMFGFARDGGLPPWFGHADNKSQTPIRAVWLAVALGFILAIPALGSSVAFAAATSVATIGLYLSYGIPILLLLIEHKRFVRGPFHLGRFSRPIAFMAVAWVSFITIAFSLPTAYPVNSQTLNYTPVAIGIVALWAFGSWFVWSHKWFKGPRRSALDELKQEPGAMNYPTYASNGSDQKDAETKSPGDLGGDVVPVVTI